MSGNTQPTRPPETSDTAVLRRVRAELASVRAERQAYIQSAERQISAFDGAIQALELILNGGDKATPAPATDQTTEVAK